MNPAQKKIQKIKMPFHWLGRMWRASFRGQSLFRKIWAAFLWIGGSFIFFTVFMTLVYTVVPVYVTPLMVIRAAQGIRADKDHLWVKKWVPGYKITSHLKLAVICAEDQNFLNHNGFDFGAIEKAIKHNKRSKRKRGASTISQQTAKNVFLWPGRSWLRKGLEVWFTWWIELIWSKKRIMTVYLNIVELGPGVYGAEGAARKFFKKPAAKMRSSEAAILAAVLPSPLRYSATRPGPFVQGRRDWVLRQMQLFGGISYLSSQPKW